MSIGAGIGCMIGAPLYSAYGMAPITQRQKLGSLIVTMPVGAALGALSGIAVFVLAPAVPVAVGLVCVLPKTTE